MTSQPGAFFVDVDGASLWSVAFGPEPSDGRPAIVAVGGWIGSSELWLGPIGHLSARYRCVTFDHRGTGATISAPSSITHRRLVDDVIAVMDAHGLGKATLAAESAGAGVALAVATRHPERVAGLVLVDPSLPETAPDDGNAFVRSLRADYEATIASFVEACVPPPAPDAIRSWGRAILARSTPEHAVALLRADVPDPPVDPYAIRTPTLLIHCAGDAIAHVDTARRLAGALTSAELRVIDGAEHVPTITRPFEIASLIEDWLVGLG